VGVFPSGSPTNIPYAFLHGDSGKKKKLKFEQKIKERGENLVQDEADQPTGTETWVKILKIHLAFTVYRP
jgi:hypothetical protein